MPIAGLQMSVPRLRLPHGAQIVRADLFDAPVEAKRSEGMGRASWEPQFLAIAEQGEGADSAAAALRQLRELVSVMRLFKPGGVGLGPYAFAPSGEGSWRRVATGAPPPRGGGYRLDEEEADAPGRAGEHAGGPSRPRRPALLGGRPLRAGLRARDRARGSQRPSSRPARGARRPGPGRRLAADARRGAGRRRLGRPARRPRADRSGAGAGAGADGRRPGRRRGRAGRAGWRRASAGSSAKPPSASSARTSTRPPTRP